MCAGFFSPRASVLFLGVMKKNGGVISGFNKKIVMSKILHIL